MYKFVAPKSETKLFANRAGRDLNLVMYGAIGEMFGGVSARDVKEELKDFDGDNISVSIHSDGGSVFDGFTIYNLLKQHPAQVSVEIDGLALSIASVIAMAADPGKLSVNGESMMMIHNPWTIAQGDFNDFWELSNKLETLRGQIAEIYSKRTSITPSKIIAMMDSESEFTGSEIVDKGFADTLIDSEFKMAAKLCSEGIPDKFLDVNPKKVDCQALKYTRANVSSRLKRMQTVSDLSRFKHPK